jgi:anti-sigma regulatory factor (Ser/Thr protein kinase)
MRDDGAWPDGVPLLDIPFTVADLRRLRLRVGECARLAGLDEGRCEEFVLAVHELISNAIQHGGGGGRVRLSGADGILYGQVSDDGPGFTEAAVPATPPDPGRDEHGRDEHGRGLWLARELTDGLRICGGTDGAVVTLMVRLPELARQPLVTTFAK